MNLNTVNEIKILLLGDSGVGKTCISHLLCDGFLPKHISPTIGCQINHKIVLKNECSTTSFISVQLHDVGGGQTYKLSRSCYYSGVSGIILVFDLSNWRSATNLFTWLREFFLFKLSIFKFKLQSQLSVTEKRRDEASVIMNDINSDEYGTESDQYSRLLLDEENQNGIPLLPEIFLICNKRDIDSTHKNIDYLLRELNRIVSLYLDELNKIIANLLATYEPISTQTHFLYGIHNDPIMPTFTLLHSLIPKTFRSLYELEQILRNETTNNYVYDRNQTTIEFLSISAIDKNSFVPGSSNSLKFSKFITDVSSLVERIRI
ncbi:hypothetical protein SNEBB_009880 [Seison nebaliae]|nr:hypothetical protein SNEBB_009880 [Seison nebaliae]